jgi:16S rRNA (guanine527-N7)-methyltransferase
MNRLKTFLSDELHINPAEYLPRFILYEKLLLGWNQKINLISRKSGSIEEHILNSIFFLTQYKLGNIKSISDIGTGGGFPGIPLKILYPEKEILLVDSIQKKVNVLNDIICKMNLDKIKTVCGRAEEISKSVEYKNKFECVISKAVSSLKNVYEWGIDFLNENGKMLFIKGGDIEKEMTELNKLKYKFKAEVVNFDYKEKKLVIIRPMKS